MLNRFDREADLPRYDPLDLQIKRLNTYMEFDFDEEQILLQEKDPGAKINNRDEFIGKANTQKYLHLELKDTSYDKYGKETTKTQVLVIKDFEPLRAKYT